MKMCIMKKFLHIFHAVVMYREAGARTNPSKFNML